MITQKLIHDLRFIVEAGARAKGSNHAEPTKQMTVDEMHTLSKQAEINITPSSYSSRVRYISFSDKS